MGFSIVESIEMVLLVCSTAVVAHVTVAMISSMVPIALSLAGVVFIVRKAMSWFKGVAK